jgi:hypothetical protein
LPGNAGAFGSWTAAPSTACKAGDWRAFLAAGLEDSDRDAIRTAERSGRLLA